MPKASESNEEDRRQSSKAPADCTVKAHFIFTNFWMNHISPRIKVIIHFAPVDDENTILYIRSYCKIARSWALDSLIAFIGKHAYKIIESQNRRVFITRKPKASS